MVEFLILLYKLIVVVFGAIPTIFSWLFPILDGLLSTNHDHAKNPKPKKNEPMAQAAKGGVGSTEPSPQEAKESSKK